MANRINVILGLDISQLERTLNRTQKQLERFASTLSNVGTTLSQTVTLPLVALGAASVRAFADLDRLRKGMIAVTGSAEAADAELTKLREVARLPGLGFQEAVQGSINLQAVGLSADEARKTLQGFGAALAVTGGGAQDLKEVQRQLTQIISKNRILQQDYGVLQERIPLIGNALELAFGTRNIENVRALGISGQEFVSRVSEALALLPETQNVAGGLANSFENLSDSLRNSAAQFGASINEALDLEGIINRLAESVQRAADWFDRLSPGMRKFIVITAAVVAAIGPLLLIIGKLVALKATLVVGIKVLGTALIYLKSPMLLLTVVVGKLKAAFSLLLTPIGATVGIIGAVVAALVFLYNRFERVRRIINAVGNTIKEVIQIFREAGAAFFEGFANLKEGNFRQANENFKKAFTAGIPTEFARQYGERVRDAFASGYADDTNYLKRIGKEFQEAINQGAASALPTAPANLPRATGGGGGGGAAARPAQTAVSTLATLPADISALQDFAQRGQLQAVLENTGAAFDRFKEQATAAFQQAQQSAAAARLQFEETLASLNLGLTTSGGIFVNWGNIINGALALGLGRISQEIEGGISSLRKFGQVVRQVAQQAIGALIKEGVTAVVAKTLVKLSGFLGPLAIPIASAAGAAASGLFNTLLNKIAPPRLAAGGITTGPTLALIGDNPSGREAVIPFEKMGQFLDMAGAGRAIRVTGLFEVKGSDLILVLDRAKQDQIRIR